MLKYFFIMIVLFCLEIVVFVLFKVNKVLFLLNNFVLGEFKYLGCLLFKVLLLKLIILF